MATLTEYYEEVDAKRASLRVVIAGVQVARVQSASWNFAIGQVPSASIRLKNPPSASIAYFADVYIEAGFNNVMQRVFTGKVMHVNPDERGCSIECVGKSWPLDFHWHKVIYTFSSVDASVAVTALLTQAGIANFEVNLPAWTIGTVCEQTLEFETYGEAITKVAEVDGGRWYEMPDGTVRVEVCDQIPALNAWRSYFGMELTGPVEGYPAGLAAPARPRLRSVKVDQEIREVKNQVFVTGCTYTQTNADGTEDSINIEGEALAPSPWVKTPSGGQAYNDLKFANELIDTAVKAGTVAGRLVTTLNRLLERIGPAVDGDPQVFLRGTVSIEDPGYSRVTGRWFTEGYRTTLDERDFVTSLNLYGGLEAGTHVTICPMALFSHVGDLEVIGDRPWIVVTFDGRGSVDPDGTALTYSWTDNQTPPIVTGTDAVVTVRADPATLVTPWEVTLTVTDADGCDDEITLTIPVDPGSEDLFVPAIFAAFDAWFSGSPDGGQTWNDQAAPGGDSYISAAVKIVTDGLTFGVGWGGTELGAIYKTADYCATAPTLVMAAVGSPIEHIWPDTNYPPDVWAIARNGMLYRSLDDGDNWTPWEDLRLVFGLPNIRLSRVATPAPDGVWVFGGDGNGMPLIAFDPIRSHAWAKAVIGGELAADLAGGVAGLYVREAASREAGELAIILDSDTHTPAVYYTWDILSANGAEWSRCLAAPAKSHGRWIAPDLEFGLFCFGFDDNVCYRGDVNPATGVMTASVAPGALAATHAPMHGVWIGNLIGGMAGCYIVAALDESGAVDGFLYKTWDRFETNPVALLRPAAGFPAAPAGARGYMVAFEGQGQPVIPGAVSHPYMIIRDNGDTDRELVRLVDGAWEAVNAAMPQYSWDLRYWGNGHMTHCVRSTLPRYSGDYGVTWNNGVAPTGVLYGPYIVCTQIDSTPGSTRLWSIWRDNTSCTPSSGRHYCIAYSDDWGATWALSLEENLTVTGTFRTFYSIACHPTDPNKVFTAGRVLQSYGRVTVDGGTTWTPWPSVGAGPGATLDTCPPTLTSAQKMSIWSVGDRMLITSQNIGDELACWSDDYGDTWHSVEMDIGTDVLNPVEFCRAGPVGPMFLCYGEAGADDVSPIFRSFDEGTSWERVDCPAAWNLNQPGQRAMAYDAYNNWMWFPMSAIGPPARDACYSFEDIYTGDEDDWVSRAYNLPAIGVGMDMPEICAVTIVWD